MGNSSPGDIREAPDSSSPAPSIVAVEESPVPAGPATLSMGARASIVEDRLVLRPPHPWAFPLFALLMLASIYLFMVRAFSDWFHTGCTTVCIIGGLGIIRLWFRQAVLSRVTFDKQAGLLLLGWKGRRGRRPLSAVIGVHVMKTCKQFGNTEHNFGSVTLHQMNLILDDTDERRLNVVTVDPSTARTIAKQVADFLGVPVLDAARARAHLPVQESEPIEALTIPSPVFMDRAPDALIVRGRRFGPLAPGLLVIAIAAVAGIAASEEVDVWLIIACGGILLSATIPTFLPLVSTLRRYARFDRSRGELTIGWLRREQPRPLHSFRAIEVAETPEHELHQLNLVPSDPRQPKVNLISDADSALVRNGAEKLGAFLCLPVVGLVPSRSDTIKQCDPENVELLELVSRSPAPAGKASVRGSARLRHKGDDVLTLLPRSRLTLLRVLSALIMFGPELYLAWLLWFGPVAGPFFAIQSKSWLVFSFVFTTSIQIAALKPLIWYRNQFDRRMGLLKIGWFGLKGSYSLKKVLAIQLIPGGLVFKAGGPFKSAREVVSYQVNLIVAGADRINLTDDSDLRWTREAGGQIAEFLDLPLLDQIADRK
jgi:hypothetical protein